MSGRPTLLLVDAQEDFLGNPGLVPDKGSFVAAAAGLLQHARQNGWAIVHVHTRVNCDLSDAMPHRRMTGAVEVIAGTPGAKAPRELQPRKNEPLLFKRFFSAFDAAGLSELLQDRAPDPLIVAGLHTHACLRATVDDAYRRGFEVVVPSECVASYDPAHASQTLDWMNGRSARVTQLADLTGSSLLGAEWLHLDPCDQRRRLGRVLLTPPAEVQRKAAELSEAQPRLEALGIARRGDLLREWRRQLESSRDQFRQSLVRDIGKPIRDAEGELAYGLALLESVITTLNDEERGEGRDVRYHPRGVVGLITPWNNPFALAISKIAPALGYANTVLWKPALPATAISELLVHSLVESGLAGWLAMVPGGAGTGDAIAAEPLVSAVSFTGSVPVGRRLIARAAVRAAPPAVQAELGGSNAAIIDSSADLAAAADDLAGAIFSYSGQRCTAIRRIIILADVADEFVERLRAATEALKIGYPDQTDINLGPLIDRAAQSRLLQAVRIARADGGRVVSGGKAPTHLPGDGCWMEPTLIEGVEPDHAINREEWFGPIAVISRARNFDQALAAHNDSSFGLIGAVYATDAKRVAAFVKQAQAGILSVGAARPPFSSSGPFAGWKSSGYGIPEHGRWNRDFYTRPQVHYVRLRTELDGPPLDQI